MVTDTIGMRLTRGPRGWPDHWAMLLRDVERLRALYAGTVVIASSEAAVDLVHKTFLVIDHMRDWVVGPSPDFPTSTVPTFADLERLANGDDCLLIANALNNTSKHRERNHGGREAWVREVEQSDGPTWVVRIEYGSPAPLVDSLELADRCLVAWRAWFASLGITVP